MGKINLSLDCERVEIQSAYGNQVTVHLESVDDIDIRNETEELIEHLDLHEVAKKRGDEIIEYMDVDDILLELKNRYKGNIQDIIERLEED